MIVFLIKLIYRNVNLGNVKDSEMLIELVFCEEVIVIKLKILLK